jgi:hypothetical protein
MRPRPSRRSRASTGCEKKRGQLAAVSGGQAHGSERQPAASDRTAGVRGRQLAARDRTDEVLGGQLAASGRLVKSSGGQLAASGRLEKSSGGQLAASGRLEKSSGGSWLPRADSGSASWWRRSSVLGSRRRTRAQSHRRRTRRPFLRRRWKTSTRSDAGRVSEDCSMLASAASLPSCRAGSAVPSWATTAPAAPNPFV